MDLDQLHTFLEIVRLKSFSKAAQTCYRTQPAISAQVRQLEQELVEPRTARQQDGALRVSAVPTRTDVPGSSARAANPIT